MLTPKKRWTRLTGLSVGLTLLGAFGIVAAQLPSPRPVNQEAERRTTDTNGKGAAEPFRGITTDGRKIPGLFPIRATGLSTGPIQQAALAFRRSLSPQQLAATSFTIDDEEWRNWSNQSQQPRRGVSFADMTPPQRQAALELLRASLSVKGLRQSRDIMRLDTTLGELTGRPRTYGETLYFVTMMGEPSLTEPWGWQLEGHHLIINYFVLGDQVVMTPTFMGSEPRSATSGVHAGISVLRVEERDGLAMINALDARQRSRAILSTPKTRSNNLAEAYRDDIVLDYAGLRATDMTEAQRAQLLALVAGHVGNVRDGHAAVKMEDVRRHLDETHFAWIGGTGPDSVFYYRVQSPVILIEFDHLGPIGLSGDRDQPTRNHVHSVVRTPNGNDYGKDLLRQHYARHSAPHRH